MIAPNSSFNPNPLRSTNNMAGRACHVVGSTTQVGLTQVLGLMISDSDTARNAIFEILDNQLAQGSPPEVRETLDRLLAAGHPEEEARRLLGCVIASEVFADRKSKRLNSSH